MPQKTTFVTYLILAFWLGVIMLGYIGFLWLKKKFGKWL